MGRTLILNSTSFQAIISNFENDEGRTIYKTDMIKLLKDFKEVDVKIKDNSSVMVNTLKNWVLNKYTNLLPQSNPGWSKTEKVQQKSEARYIVERSI